jgi:predicted TIM-barrel fold metal-dependent hydrolase
MRPVIDTHVHLDDSIPGSAVNAARALDNSLAESDVVRAIVLHLGFQRWSIEEFAEAISRYERLVGFVNIHPDSPGAVDDLNKAVHQLGCQGLKLHPRLQRHAIDSANTIRLVRHAGEIGVPVIICGFPDGDWLMQGSTVLNYANLAKACAQTRIVVAHMGGHHVIDLMMLAKRIPNLYLDTSYSLLYYRGSAIVQNLIYAMHSMRFERIFYGSDYPDRAVGETLIQSKTVFQEYGLSEEQMFRILYQNAKEFFGWIDV